MQPANACGVVLALAYEDQLQQQSRNNKTDQKN